MDDVKEFSNELNSLYNVKPPISRAKMTSITRLALKSLKHYKHVVQSIEKFIHKCQAEYKLPGLYVIDSIVRQSRHQYGADKDPFAGRFSRNIAVTFHDLLTCPPQEICKIVRVLNLWQKNSMFPPQIIQPLLDMAANPTSQEVYATAQKAIQQVTGFQPSSIAPHQGRNSAEITATSDFSGELNSQPTDILRALSSQLLLPLLANPQLYLQLLQQQLLLQQATAGNIMPEIQQSFVPQIDSNLMAQIQALTAALMARVGTPQQEQRQNQQASNTTTMTAITSNLDTTTDSLQSSDFHGDFTSPAFSNKKAGMSDMMSDNEYDKTADQMSVSSISTPAINTNEVPDGGLATGPAYSPSGDHVDSGQLVTSSTHIPSMLEMGVNASADTIIPLCNASLMPETNALSKSSTHNYNTENNTTAQKTSQKSNYNLFSPVSPINSVPNSPSEESGTPVLDEIPSPRICRSEVVTAEDKKGTYLEGQENENKGHLASSNHMEGLDEQEQTPEEGEILANEVEGSEQPVNEGHFSSYPVATGEKHKRKRSKRSKEKRDRLKVAASERNQENVKRYEPIKEEVSPKSRKEVKVVLNKKEKESRKKKKKNKDRLSASGSRTDFGKRSRRSSISMADQTIVVDDKPRKYFVVLDELPELSHDIKKSKRKRSPSPEPIASYSKTHISRRDVFASREHLERSRDLERQTEKRTRVESAEEAKDKKRRKHSKDSHRSRHTSVKADHAVQISSMVVSNGNSHVHSTSGRVRSKSSRKKSPRKEDRHRRSRSRDRCPESSRVEKSAIKNRIYRAKSVSADPVPMTERKSRSRSKDKKSSKKGMSSKKSKQSPTKHAVMRLSPSKKGVRSKSSHKSKEKKESKHDKSRTSEKEKHAKKQSSSLSSSSSSLTGADKDEISDKLEYSLPPIKEKHACVCSTTLWIGPISRHTKKEDVKKELHKYSKPTLVDVVIKQSCVYVAFETRREAVDLMHALNDTTLCGKTVKVTWAPGSGIKQSKFLSRWDVDLGATYIPWDKLPYNMEAITQGGVLDVSSMPPQSENVTIQSPQLKEKEVSVKAMSPILFNFTTDDECKSPKVPRKDEDHIESSLSEIQLPSEIKILEKELREKSSHSHDQDKSKDSVLVVISEEDLLSIALPPLPPPVTEAPNLGNDKVPLEDQQPLEVSAIELDDSMDVICEEVGPAQVIEDPVFESVQQDQKAEKNVDLQNSRNGNKAATSNKFSFSIESHNINPDKVETLKKGSDFDGEVESIIDDKASDAGICDDLSNTETLPVKPGLEKKPNKTSKPEILKGKIKFGVISAFSGWANKQKLSAAAATPSVTSNEDKQKEDARSLYETLMERINSKSKSLQQTGNTSTSVTHDGDFLSSIKVPSPKPTESTSRIGIEKKSGDMSEAYDPFENYPDSGGNSPICKTTSTHSNSLQALGPSPLSLVSSSVQNFGIQQSVALFHDGPYPVTSNLSLPIYQGPPLPHNVPFGRHPLPIRNILPPVSNSMITNNFMVPHQPNVLVPATSNAPLGTKPFIASHLPPLTGFAVSTPLPPQSKPQPSFPQNSLILSSSSVLQVNVASAFPSLTNSNVQLQSFNIPPPGIPMNRLPNSLFSPSDNSKFPPVVTTLPLNIMTTSIDVFTRPPLTSYSYTNMPPATSAVVLANSSQAYNTSNNLEANHPRRPPLLAEPPNEVATHLSAQMPAGPSPANSWSVGPHNQLPLSSHPRGPLVLGSFSNIPQSRPLELPRTCDWPRNPSLTNIGNVPVSVQPLMQSQNVFSIKGKEFSAANYHAPYAGNVQNHLDHSITNDSQTVGHQWEQSRMDIVKFGTARDESAERKFSQAQACKSAEVDSTSERPRAIDNSGNLGNPSQKNDNYHMPPETLPSGRIDADGEPIFKIESVVPNTKHQHSDGREQSLNTQKPFSEPHVNPEKLAGPPAFFNVPPPVIPQQLVRGNVNALIATSQRPPQAIPGMMDVRMPRAIAQEFSKLLNSPVTFDCFSKNLPSRDNVRFLGNPNMNSGFIQRPAVYNNDGLLGPAPMNSNFNIPNKVVSDRPPQQMASSLPSDFNKNLPPPLLPQQVGLRNVLLPSPVDRTNKNSELRYQPPPLLNPTDFLNSLQPGQRHETPHRQMRFGDAERRGIGREGGGPRFPRKPFNHPRGQKHRFGMEGSRFDDRGGSSRYN